VIFYILAPIPTIIARRNGTSSDSSSCLELSIFLTLGVVISSFALPIVLARAQVILWGAANFTIFGNVVTYITLLVYFISYDSDESLPF
jgi:Vacuolar protein sorting 55